MNLSHMRRCATRSCLPTVLAHLVRGCSIFAFAAATAAATVATPKDEEKNSRSNIFLDSWIGFKAALLALSLFSSFVFALFACVHCRRRKAAAGGVAFSAHKLPCGDNNRDTLRDIEDAKLASLMREMSFDETNWLQSGQTFTIDIPELDFGGAAAEMEDDRTASGKYLARRLDSTYVPSAEGVLYVARVVSEEEARARIDHDLYAPILLDKDPHYERLPDASASSGLDTQVVPHVHGPALPPRRPRSLQLYAVLEPARGRIPEPDFRGHRSQAANKGNKAKKPRRGGPQSPRALPVQFQSPPPLPPSRRPSSTATTTSALDNSAGSTMLNHGGGGGGGVGTAAGMGVALGTLSGTFVKAGSLAGGAGGGGRAGGGFMLPDSVLLRSTDGLRFSLVFDAADEQFVDHFLLRPANEEEVEEADLPDAEPYDHSTPASPGDPSVHGDQLGSSPRSAAERNELFGTLVDQTLITDLPLGQLTNIQDKYLEVQAHEEIYENPDDMQPRRRSFFGAVRSLLGALRHQRPAAMTQAQSRASRAPLPGTTGSPGPPQTP